MSHSREKIIMIRVFGRRLSYFRPDRTFAEISANLSEGKLEWESVDLKAESIKMKEKIGKCSNQGEMLSVLVDYRENGFYELYRILFSYGLSLSTFSNF